MSDHVHFETPENVEISYALAGLGTRFVAWLLDQILVVVITISFIILALIAGAVSEQLFREFLESMEITDEEDVPRFMAYMAAVLYLVYAFGSFVYFGLMELLMRGQTLGKRKMGIRVVDADGFGLRTEGILLRTAFRVADHIPLLWIIPVVSPKAQRLGDMVARTVVITEKPEEDALDVRERLARRDMADLRYRFPAPALRKASQQDILLAERLVERLPKLTDEQALPLLGEIVPGLCDRIEVEQPPASDYRIFTLDFLTSVYRSQHRRLG